MSFDEASPRRDGLAASYAGNTAALRRLKAKTTIDRSGRSDPVSSSHSRGTAHEIRLQPFFESLRSNHHCLCLSRSASGSCTG